MERYWNLDQPVEELNAFTIRILNTEDERVKLDEFLMAKKDEVGGLNKRQIWTTFKEAQVPKDANVLGGRFIMTLNICNTTDEKENIRYVAHGFNDRDKPYMVHDASTIMNFVHPDRPVDSGNYEFSIIISRSYTGVSAE